MISRKKLGMDNAAMRGGWLSVKISHETQKILMKVSESTVILGCTTATLKVKMAVTDY